MIKRRIPAQRSQAYTRWAPPDVAQDRVVKAETPRGERRLPVEQAPAEVWQRESFEKQLVDNIKAGRFASGISARQLETIVRESAREGREDGYNQGFAKGQQEGYEQGRTEGLAAGRAIMEDAARRMSGLIEALQQPLREQQEELRESMLKMVSRIARAVIRADLQLQPESIRKTVTEAIDALPLGAANIQVYVCEADRDLLVDYGSAERQWSLHIDESLQAGDCRVESTESLVSYTVSERFATMIGQFLGGVDQDSNGTSS